MSKKILTLALAASLLSGSLLGTAPAFAAGKKIVSLNILNEKSVYKVFDMDFLQVEATFDDGTKSIIPNNDLLFKTYSYQLDQGTNTWGYKDSTTISYTDSGTMFVKGEGVYKIEADLKEDPTIKTQKEVSTDKTNGITSLQNSYVLSSSTVARGSGLAEIYFILPDLKNASGQKYKVQDESTGQLLFETSDSFYLYNQVVPNKNYKFKVTLLDGTSEKDSVVKEVNTFNSIAPKVNNISYDAVSKRLTVNASSATNEPLYYQFNNNDMTTNPTFDTSETIVDIKVIDRQGNVSESVYNTTTPVQNPTLKSLSITDPIDKISLRKDQVFDLSALKFDLLKTDGTKVSNVPVQYSVESGKENLVTISGTKVSFTSNTPVGTAAKVYVNYTSGAETVRTSLDLFYYSADSGSSTTPTPTPGTGNNNGGNNNNGGTTTSPLKSVGILNSQYIYPLSQKNGLDLSKITFQATYEDGKVKTLSPTTGMKFESKSGNVPVTFQNGWLTVPTNTAVNTVIEVNASYTEGSVTKTIPLQVIVVNDTTQSGTLKELNVTDQKYIYTLNTKTGFDMNSITFMGKYEDGTSKRILSKDMSFKWVSGASDIVVTNGVLTLRNTVSNNSLIEVLGSYVEGGVTKTVNLHFMASNDETQSNSVLNNFKVTNSTGLVNVDVSSGYDLSKLNFEASYLDGTNKKINVSSITFTSNTKDVNITTTNGILKMDSKVEDRKVVDVIATYKEGNVSKTLTLQFINAAQSASLLSIDNVLPQYEINAGQTIELKNMKFKVYYSDGKIVEKTGDDQALEKVVQVKDQNKLDMTKFQTKTIQFNSSAKVGDQVEIELFYTEQGKKVSTKVTVKLTETATTPIPNTQSKFTDVKGHWAEKEIIEMANKNFVTGYLNGSFQPNKAITRGEVASIVARYLNLPKGDKVPFNDVIEVDWNYEDIAKVYQSGIFKGYENNTFKPKEKITREELAVLLVRMHEYRYGVTDVSNNTLPFKDESKIGKWAISSVKKAQGLSLILGKENYRFAPRDNATRAEVTAILYRSMETK